MLRKLFGVPAEASTASEPPSAARTTDDDRMLDALAEILRCVGRHAHDTDETTADETAQEAERWAAHLLLRRPRPGDSAGDAAGSLDVPGAVRFVTHTRKRESAFVLRALFDLRQTVWAFVHSLNGALAEDAAADATVSTTLARLRDAAERGTTEELRDMAVTTATTVAALVRSRERRHESQRLELGQRIAALGRQLEEARREREFDALTGIYNRGALDDHLRRIVDLRALRSESVSLLMVDVDHFKAINDGYGHPVGDQVLKRIAQCLAQTFLRKTDLVARYGGEEFAVVLRDTDCDLSRTLAERARTAVRRLAFPELDGRTVTVSIGTATVAPTDDVTTWTARADRALYEAKHAGRDRVSVAA